MKNRIITHFYLKELKKNRNGEAPIYLRITINGERSEISTNRKVNPALWNKTSERVNGRTEYSQIINSSLNSIIGKVERLFSNLDIKDEMINVQLIVNELKGKSQNQMTIIKAYEYHIANIEKLIGIDFAETTVRKYKSSLNSLKRFLNNKDIRLSELDYKFIEDYHTHLRTTEAMQHNSASKNIKNLYRVISISIRNKWLFKNPFENFSCKYVNPTRYYLTESEIDSLITKNITIDRLAKVRDIFVFQIYTGLSFIDMYELTKDNIEIGVDGKEWIVITRKKTGVRSAIPILPRAKEILNRYHDILPICSNQRMNGYLKEIADICGINKNLTTHIGRHTFSTTVTLSNGIPIETVSKLLGHSSLKTTQIYAKVVDRKVSDDMKILFDKKTEPKIVLGKNNQEQSPPYDKNDIK